MTTRGRVADRLSFVSLMPRPSPWACRRSRAPFGPAAVVERRLVAEQMRAERQHRRGDARAAGRDDRLGEIDARARRTRPAARRRVFHVPSALNSCAVAAGSASPGYGPACDAGARIGLLAGEARRRARIDAPVRRRCRRSPSSGRACGRPCRSAQTVKWRWRSCLLAARDRRAPRPATWRGRRRGSRRRARRTCAASTRRAPRCDRANCRRARCGCRRRARATASGWRTSPAGGSIVGQVAVGIAQLGEVQEHRAGDMRRLILRRAHRGRCRRDIGRIDDPQIARAQFARQPFGASPARPYASPCARSVSSQPGRSRRGRRGTPPPARASPRGPPRTVSPSCDTASPAAGCAPSLSSCRARKSQ